MSLCLLTAAACCQPLSQQDALVEAVKHNDVEKAARLIAAGAKLEASDDFGHTPLAHYLLYKGARVNGGDMDGRTPLIYAVLYSANDLQQPGKDDSYREIVTTLIQQGADIKAQDHNGKPARQLAFEAGKAELAKLLKTPAR